MTATAELARAESVRLALIAAGYGARFERMADRVSVRVLDRRSVPVARVVFDGANWTTHAERWTGGAAVIDNAALTYLHAVIDNAAGGCPLGDEMDPAGLSHSDQDVIARQAERDQRAAESMPSVVTAHGLQTLLPGHDPAPVSVKGGCQARMF